MPESYGKRQRQGVKARKAAAKEERRIERNRRKDVREGGGVDEHEGAEPAEVDEGATEEGALEEGSQDEGSVEEAASEDEPSGA